MMLMKIGRIGRNPSAVVSAQWFSKKMGENNSSIDEFRLHEFGTKCLENRPVQFTEKLKIHDWRTTETFPIYRVTHASGEFVDGAQDPHFSDETLLKMYHCMTKLNAMDKILYESQRQGSISFYMTSRGDEASHIGSAAAFDPMDLVYGQYREAGVIMWRGFSLEQCMSQSCGKDFDMGKGRQTSGHYGSVNLNFVANSTPVSTQILQAVGSAFAFKNANAKETDESKKRIVCCYFGEVAASEEDAHSAFNFAATLKCPIIFFCRNNGYAISTPTAEKYSSDAIAGKGPAYGLHTIRVDGNDIFAVYNATKEARKMALQNHPVMIEAMTYRIGHHSISNDSTAYRSADEVIAWQQKDYPIIRFRKYLEKKGLWDDQKEEQLLATLRKDVREALANAEKALLPTVESVFEDVYTKSSLCNDLKILLKNSKMHTEMHEKSADAAAWYHITAFAFALLYFVLPQLKQYFDNINEQVSKNSQDLLAEERNLFSYAFKNSVTVRRDNWRVLTAHELKLDEADPVKEVAMRCREQIEIELRGLCNQGLEAVNKSLIAESVDVVSKVFYSKMKGNYLGYLAEISTGDARQEAVEKSRAAYTEGLETAKKEMSPAHPIRLDLVLNFAVFYYEIGNSPYKACQLVKQSLEDALPDVEKIEDGMKQDSRMILQLLRDNLSLWTVLDFEKKKGNKKLWFTW